MNFSAVEKKMKRTKKADDLKYVLYEKRDIQK